MKTNKIFKYLVGAVLFAGMLSACSDDLEYKKAPQESGGQVYFPDNAPTQYNIGEDISTVAIPVKRVETDGVLTVPVLSHEVSGLFAVPSSVTFADGNDTADLLISFPRTQLAEGINYPISLLLNDEDNTTIYGSRMLTVNVMPWPWEFMKDSQGKELKTGKYREDWLFTVFSGLSSFEMDVTVYKHKSQEGIYMVENMFGWPYMTTLFKDTQANIAKEGFSYTPSNIVFDCSDPTAVKIDTQFSGITHAVYGKFSIYSAEDGTLVDGAITFPQYGLRNVFAGYGTFNVNKYGLFRVVLPGYEAFDYSLSVAYEGMTIASDNVTVKPVFNFTYGTDVTGIKYVFVAGDVTANKDAIAATIVDNTASNIYEIKNLDKTKSKVSVEASLTPGVYTVVALAKNKTGALVSSPVAAQAFYFPGMGEMDGLVVGTYSMPYESGTKTNTFQVTSAVLGSKTAYKVTNIGITNGASWVATYDKNAATLTLNGLEFGHEADGNQFGAPYYFINDIKTQIYKYLSSAYIGSDGSDPLVFAVDPDTEKIMKLLTKLEIAVYQVSDESYVGPYSSFAVNTPVTYVSGLASASATSVATTQGAGLNNQSVSSRHGISTLSVKTGVCDPLPKQKQAVPFRLCTDLELQK